VLAVVTAVFSRAVRVEVHSSLARWTWAIAESARLEARRWGISCSRGELVVVGESRGEEWEREAVEVEDIMVGRFEIESSCLLC